MKREDLFELSESDFRVLLEDLIEFLSLFVVGHETNHFKDSVESISVKLLFVSTITTFKLEDFSEVLILHVVHTSTS